LLRTSCAAEKKIGAPLSSTQEFNETQLAAARAKAWHQDGEALLTLEATRDWINERGIVLFAPRAAQLPAPAPTLVEATLGAANAAPTLSETEIARGLVSRLVGEGLALPLNLLSVPGDSPDFVVSAQVFSYIFTMRGDKAWKQPPATSGAVKVSPLSLRVFEVLTERGPMSAAELALELGREVTETAILRSLSELWSQLRVLPLLQVGEGVTLWELTTRRFTKAIKAGANAGLPTALSALISLYLTQSLAATEEEIVTYLSPLTARSRVREVLHALLGARQLETVVLEGKTLLHVPGTLPAFTAVAPEGEEAEDAPAIKPKKIGTGRISSFTSERKPAAELRGKPAKTFGVRAGAARGPGPVKPSARFGARLDGKTDSERRPFKKDAKPSFTKPWSEDRKPKSAAPDSFTKFRRPAPEDREPLGAREQAGLPPEKRSAPKSSFDRAAKPGGFAKPGSFAKRPYTPRSTASGEERPTFKPRSYESKERTGGFAAKRPYTPRTAESGDRSASKPSFGAKRPFTPRSTEGGERPYAKRPYTPRTSGDNDAKPTFGAKRPYTPRTFGDADAKPGFGAKRPYTPRTSGDSDAKPSFGAKRPYTPRTAEGGERSFSKPSFGSKSPYARKTEGSSGGGFAKRPYVKRTAFTPVPDTVERTMPKRPYKPRAADAENRAFTKAPWTPTEDSAPKRSARPAGRPSGKPRFGGKPGGKPFAKRTGPSGPRKPRSAE
jgi:23S rRNA pseudouridine2605 synthase